METVGIIRSPVRAIALPDNRQSASPRPYQRMQNSYENGIDLISMFSRTNLQIRVLKHRHHYIFHGATSHLQCWQNGNLQRVRNSSDPRACLSRARQRL